MSSAPVTKKATKPRKPKVPAAHPPVFDMIKAAIVATKDRKGTSLATIKKYVAEHYKVDLVKIAPHVRRVLVSHVADGSLVRVGNKGHGASGSFKLGERAAAKPKVKKDAKPKVAKAKKVPAKPKKATVKKPKVAKTKTPKKAAAKSKIAKAKTPKKPKAAAKPKVAKVKTLKKPAPKK